MDLLDVIILAGGKGTRLSSIVSDRPKPLAIINGEPFLDILLRELRRNGLTRFIIATGFLREKIIDRYKNDNDVVIVEETSPLGTGGGLKNAIHAVKANSVLVLNGDSYIEGTDQLVLNSNSSSSSSSYIPFLPHLLSFFQ